jgi:hypothetical protein
VLTGQFGFDDLGALSHPRFVFVRSALDVHHF